MAAAASDAAAAASDAAAVAAAVPDLFLQNVVLTFQLWKRRASGAECKVDLSRLVATVPLFEAQKPFASATLRLTSPRSTFLVFDSGKCVCAGTKSEVHAHQAVHEFLRTLREFTGDDLVSHDPCVQNVVATARCGFALDLWGLRKVLPGRCQYEPSLFPGLIWHMSEAVAGRVSVPRAVVERATVLVFHSGRCNVVGARCSAGALEVWRVFYETWLRGARSQHVFASSGQYRVHVQDTDQPRGPSAAALAHDGEGVVSNALGEQAIAMEAMCALVMQ